MPCQAAGKWQDQADPGGDNNGSDNPQALWGALRPGYPVLSSGPSYEAMLFSSPFCRWGA